jgi:hypothetical protein
MKITFLKKGVRGAVANAQHHDERLEGVVDVNFHNERSILAKLKGSLAEKMSAYSIIIMSDDQPPTADETTGCSSDSELSSLDERPRPNVQFSNVMIRNYAITVGDTPSHRTYPLSLDWEYSTTQTLDINTFEELFSSAKTKQRTKTIRGFRLPARLNASQRFDRLAEVTGQGPIDLCGLESERMKRMERMNRTPPKACSTDGDYDELCWTMTPDQLLDTDKHHLIDI